MSAMDKSEPDYPNERPFPSHIYPLIPTDMSAEYIFFLLSLVILTVEYASPFYFTSRVFSLLFSSYTALTSVYLLIDVDTIAIIYKLSTAGVRDPGGSLPIDINLKPTTFSPWHILALSAAGLPAVIIGLLGIYAYGESQFKSAVLNYAKLLVTGELPSRGNSAQKQQTTCDTVGSTRAMSAPSEEQADFEFSTNFSELPLTLAVTTKPWRPPPPSSRRNGQNNKRCETPTPGSRVHGNGSEISGTLRRSRGITMAESAELTNSMHTLTETTDSMKHSSSRWSRVGFGVISSLCFFWLLVTRICLAGPVLHCFWDTELEIALVDIILSVLYIICWLLLLFGLSVKTAWRFRLLHTADCFYPTNNGNGSAQRFSIPAGFCTDLMGSPSAQNIQLAMNGAYPNLWPYLSYPQWVGNGTGMMAGLPVNGNGNIHNMMPASNPNINEIHGGSGGDSLYGCFPDAPDQQQQNLGNGVFSGYSAQTHGMPLRAGPPTLSDESDATVNNFDHMDMSNKYFKPVPNHNAGVSTYTNKTNNRFSDNHRNDASPLFNTPYQSNSNETSPFEAYDELHPQNPGKVKGSRVAAIQGLLQKQNMNPKPSEPTYATLATLSRPAANDFRSGSVTPGGAEVLDQPSPPHLTRNPSCRRNGSRVTFKENELSDVGYRIAPNDGATGSSDSGVYTNGHGSGLNQTGPYVERQSNRAKSRSETPNSINGTKRQKEFTHRQKSVSPNVIESSFHTFKKHHINQIDENDDVEISTDLTTYGIKDAPKIHERVAYFNHQSSTIPDGDDRLCSQV